MSYARVFLNQKHKRIDRAYDYGIPESLKVRPGMRVVVPFGRGNAEREGFVVALAETTEVAEKTKNVLYTIDEEPVLTPAQIELCLHLKHYYCALFYEALSPFLNPVKTVTKKAGDRVYLTAYHQAEDYFCRGEIEPRRLGPKQQLIYDLLADGPCSRREITAALGSVSASLRTLVEKGYVLCYQSEGDMANEPSVKDVPAVPKSPWFSRYALGRVDGRPLYFSGLTEEERTHLYASIIADNLAQGRQTLVLSPRIEAARRLCKSLSESLDMRPVLYHGELKQRERYEIFQGLRRGRYPLVVGTRAALFMPGPKLGTVIVDQPGEADYHADSAMPKYETEELLRRYCPAIGAELVLCDDVQSVAAAAALKAGDYFPASDRPVPPQGEPVCIADMQAEMKAGNHDFLSRSLRAALEECLTKKKTAVLLLNKLGYASYVFCRSCGHVARCPRCGLTLEATAEGALWHCSGCGYRQRPDKTCPSCQAPSLHPLGLGVDRAAAALTARYPEAKVLKLDAAVLADKEKTEQITAWIAAGAYDIIIGTKVLLRPWPFKNVGLAAALLADSDINVAVYNAAEKAFRLYHRFFARFEAKKYIQTYEGESSTIRAIAGPGVEGFYAEEAHYRRRLGYPPYGHLVSLVAFGDSRPGVEADGRRLYQAICQRLPQQAMTVYQPVFRARFDGRPPKNSSGLTIKTKQLHYFHELMGKLIDEGIIAGLYSKVSVDIDPID